MAIKTEWVPTDGWRGYEKPVPPEGYEVLLECHIVNEAGSQLGDIVKAWLRKRHIRCVSGALQTSNVFSARYYIVIEAGKISSARREAIDDWYVDANNATFSIMTGESWELSVPRAKREFAELMRQFDDQEKGGENGRDDSGSTGDLG